MTTEGWFFMLCSLSLVIGLVSYCYWRILSKPSSAESMHAPLEIDTGDLDENGRSAK